MKPNLIFLLFIVSVVQACQSPEAEKKITRVPPVNLALRIWGEEGKESFHCLAQVQSVESRAVPGKLDAGEKITVDGVLLEADSARYSGVFYQAELPIDQFAGEHLVSFTSEDGRTHTEKFEFMQPCQNGYYKILAPFLTKLYSINNIISIFNNSPL